MQGGVRGGIFVKVSKRELVVMGRLAHSVVVGTYVVGFCDGGKRMRGCRGFAIVNLDLIW